MQQRIAEQAEDVPQFSEETVEMARCPSHDRVQKRTIDHIVDECILQIMEEDFDFVKSVFSKQISQLFLCTERVFRCAQDLNRRPNLAQREGGVPRCHRAAVGGTLVDAVTPLP